MKEIDKTAIIKAISTTMKPNLLTFSYGKRKITFVAHLIIFLAVPLNLLAQEDSTKLLPLFSSNEILEITLQFDMKKLMQAKYKEDYLPASIIYNQKRDANVTPDTVNLKIRARGHSRKRICQFPPLRLNFNSKNNDGSLFAGLDKVKMVCYCKNSDMYEQYILKEYYVYKLYELFTERSFKTRLLRVKYKDSRGKRKTIERYGFIIENEKDFAKRIHAHPFEINQLHPRNCDKTTTKSLAIFQYMIGNKDWSVAKQHNVKLFVPAANSGESRPFPVPYDFDYSGLVNAHYAEVSDILPIEEITDRYYLGYCGNEEAINYTLADFKKKEEVVLNVFSEDKLLDEKEKEEALEYLKAFYNLLKKEGTVLAALKKQCKE